MNNGRNHQHTIQAILNMNDKIVPIQIRTIIIPNKMKKTRPKPAKQSSNPCSISLSKLFFVEYRELLHLMQYFALLSFSFPHFVQ